MESDGVFDFVGVSDRRSARAPAAFFENNLEPDARRLDHAGHIDLDRPRLSLQIPRALGRWIRRRGIARRPTH